MVTIATFNEPAKARQLKRRFQDAGLRADVHNEAPLQQVGFVSRPLAEATVTADGADFEAAQNPVAEWGATALDSSAALRAGRQCRSTDLEYPATTRTY